MDTAQYFEQNRTPDVVVRNVQAHINTKYEFQRFIEILTGIRNNEYKSFYLMNQSQSYYTIFIKCRNSYAHFFLADILNGEKFQNERIIATINTNNEKEIANQIMVQRTTTTTVTTTTSTSTRITTTTDSSQIINTNSSLNLNSEPRINRWKAYLENIRNQQPTSIQTAIKLDSTQTPQQTTQSTQTDLIRYVDVSTQTDLNFYVDASTQTDNNEFLEDLNHDSVDATLITGLGTFGSRVRESGCPVCLRRYTEIRADSVVFLRNCLHVVCLGCANTIINSAQVNTATCSLCNHQFNQEDIIPFLI